VNTSVLGSANLHPATYIYSFVQVSSRKLFQLDYLMVARLVLVIGRGLISYSPHMNELGFTLRLIEAEGMLHLPFDFRRPFGPTIGDEQGKMIDWLSKPIHGEPESWNQVEDQPTDIQLQAMFYGFSYDTERVSQWLDGVLGMEEGFLSRIDKVKMAMRWLKVSLGKKRKAFGWR